METKNLGFCVESRYLSSDQWLNLSVAEGWTYEEYCISAKNNRMTVATKEQWGAAVHEYHERADAYMKGG